MTFASHDDCRESAATFTHKHCVWWRIMKTFNLLLRLYPWSLILRHDLGSSTAHQQTLLKLCRTAYCRKHINVLYNKGSRSRRSYLMVKSRDGVWSDVVCSHIMTPNYVYIFINWRLNIMRHYIHQENYRVHLAVTIEWCVYYWIHSKYLVAMYFRLNSIYLPILKKFKWELITDWLV